MHQNRLRFDQNALLRKVNEKVKEMMKKEQTKNNLTNKKKFYVKKNGKLIKKTIDLDKQGAMENEI